AEVLQLLAESKSEAKDTLMALLQLTVPGVDAEGLSSNLIRLFTLSPGMPWDATLAIMKKFESPQAAAPNSTKFTNCYSDEVPRQMDSDLRAKKQALPAAEIAAMEQYLPSARFLGGFDTVSQGSFFASFGMAFHFNQAVSERAKQASRDY